MSRFVTLTPDLISDGFFVGFVRVTDGSEHVATMIAKLDEVIRPLLFVTFLSEFFEMLHEEWQDGSSREGVGVISLVEPPTDIHISEGY